AVECGRFQVITRYIWASDWYLLFCRSVKYGPGDPAFAAKGNTMSSSQYPGYAPAPAANRTNGLAIAALISSFFISLLGVILGHIALNQISRTGEGGRGLAIAGLVIGYAGIVIGVLVFISV